MEIGIIEAGSIAFGSPVSVGIVSRLGAAD